MGKDDLSSTTQSEDEMEDCACCDVELCRGLVVLPIHSSVSSQVEMSHRESRKVDGVGSMGSDAPVQVFRTAQFVQGEWVPCRKVEGQESEDRQERTASHDDGVMQQRRKIEHVSRQQPYNTQSKGGIRTSAFHQRSTAAGPVARRTAPRPSP